MAINDPEYALRKIKSTVRNLLAGNCSGEVSSASSKKLERASLSSILYQLQPFEHDNINPATQTIPSFYQARTSMGNGTNNPNLEHQSYDVPATLSFHRIIRSFAPWYPPLSTIPYTNNGVMSNNVLDDITTSTLKHEPLRPATEGIHGHKIWNERRSCMRLAQTKPKTRPRVY